MSVAIARAEAVVKTASGTAARYSARSVGRFAVYRLRNDLVFHLAA